MFQITSTNLRHILVVRTTSNELIRVSQATRHETISCNNVQLLVKLVVKYRINFQSIVSLQYFGEFIAAMLSATNLRYVSVLFLEQNFKIHLNKIFIGISLI